MRESEREGERGEREREEEGATTEREEEEEEEGDNNLLHDINLGARTMSLQTIQ